MDRQLIATAERLIADDFQLGHSELQIRSFIVGANGSMHPFGMYQQALKQIDSAVEAIQAKQIELDKLQSDDEVKGQERILRRFYLHRSLVAIERELAVYVRIARELRDGLGELTESRRAELEEDHRCHRLLYMAAVSFLRSGCPDADVVEKAAALPPRLRARVMPYLMTPGAGKVLLGWLLSGAAPGSLPSPEQLHDHASRIDEGPGQSADAVHGDVLEDTAESLSGADGQGHQLA